VGGARGAAQRGTRAEGRDAWCYVVVYGKTAGGQRVVARVVERKSEERVDRAEQASSDDRAKAPCRWSGSQSKIEQGVVVV
jgi:hypothetical protein